MITIFWLLVTIIAKIERFDPLVRIVLDSVGIVRVKQPTSCKMQQWRLLSAIQNHRLLHGRLVVRLLHDARCRTVHLRVKLAVIVSSCLTKATITVLVSIAGALTLNMTASWVNSRVAF